MLSSSTTHDGTPQDTHSSAEATTEKGRVLVEGTDTQTEGNCAALVRIPRYMRVPKCVLQTRKRYPHVCHTFYLECCRCRQWVAVEITRCIPHEANAFVEIDTSKTEKNRQLAEKWEAFRKSNFAQDGNASVPVESVRRRRHGSGNSGGSSVPPDSAPVNGVANCRFTSPRLRAILEQHEKIKKESEGDASRKLVKKGVSTDASNGKTALEEEINRFDLFSALLQDKKKETSSSSSAKKGDASADECYYMPNPFVFHCKWHLCDKEDQLAHLRSYWLRDLYRAVARQQQQQQQRQKPKAEPEDALHGSQAFANVAQFREALNHHLAMELDVKRSERIKSSPNDVSQCGDAALMGTSSPNGADKHLGKPHNDAVSRAKLEELRLVAQKFSFENDEANRRLHQAWLQTAAHHLLHEGGKDTILSSFCWASCARCGKRRRLAQPHPGGGAPFLCCLLPSVGGCHVSELDGLVQYTTAYVGQRLERVALSSPCLPPPLKEVYASQRRQWWATLLREERERTSTGESNSSGKRKTAGEEEAEAQSPADMEESLREYLLRLLLQDAFLLEVQKAVKQKLISDAAVGKATASVAADTGMKRREKAKDSTAAARQALTPITPLLPQLHEVATAVKQKSLGSFVHYVMLTPQEVREKREAILRESLLQDHPVPQEEKTDRDTQQKIRKRGAAARQASSEATAAAAATAAVAAVAASSEEKEEDGRQDKRKKRVKVEAEKGRRDRQTEAAHQEREEKKQRKARRTATKQEEDDVVTASAPKAQETKVKRGRKKKEEKNSAAANDDEEVLHWVQCDKCDKWRIVQEAIPKHVTYWECRMRPNTTCADPDDANLDVY